MGRRRRTWADGTSAAIQASHQDLVGRDGVHCCAWRRALVFRIRYAAVRVRRGLFDLFFEQERSRRRLTSFQEPLLQVHGYSRASLVANGAGGAVLCSASRCSPSPTATAQQDVPNCCHMWP